MITGVAVSIQGDGDVPVPAWAMVLLGAVVLPMVLQSSRRS
jgi:hypothetical protein